MRKVTINVIYANLLALVIFAVTLVIEIVAARLIFGDMSFFKGNIFSDSIAFIAFIIVLFILHELIHALFFGMAGKGNFKNIKYGFMKGCPYCHLKVPISKKGYIISLIAPTILVGIIPAVLSVVFGSIVWILLSAVMISGGAGDLWILLLVMKQDKKAMIQDLSDDIGFGVIEGNKPVAENII